jgi:hypothetical protein
LLLACRFERGRAQQRADLVGTKRRMIGHGGPPTFLFVIPAKAGIQGNIAMVAGFPLSRE